MEQAAWLQAERAAGLGLWQVEAQVEVKGAESGLRLGNPLTDVHCRVDSPSPPPRLRPSLYVLARVVEHQGQHVISGIHPEALEPADGRRVTVRARRYLRCRGSIEPNRLLDFKTGRALIRYWEEALAARR